MVPQQVQLKDWTFTTLHGDSRTLIEPVSEEEIVAAVKHLGDNKAPGVDGYNAKFFKYTWSIVGKDVTRAVKDFFHNKDFMRLSTVLLSHSYLRQQMPNT